MKKWYINKKLSFMLGFLSTLSLMLVACGKDNQNNPPVPVNYNPNAMYGCATGSYYNGGYCYGGNGQVMSQYTGINFVTDNYSYRNFQIANGGAYENFLKKAMGVCDRAQSNGGIYDCSSWLSGYAQVVIQVPSAQTQNLRITFSAYPYTSQYGWYGYQLPSLSQFFLGMVGFPVFDTAGAMKNPLPLDMTLSAINQSKGFEGRGYGDIYTLANRSLVQLVVATGKLEDQQFDYELAFEGVVFARGKFVRY